VLLGVETHKERRDVDKLATHTAQKRSMTSENRYLALASSSSPQQEPPVATHRHKCSSDGANVVCVTEATESMPTTKLLTARGRG
jgi:hypothetical protein